MGLYDKTRQESINQSISLYVIKKEKNTNLAVACILEIACVPRTFNNMYIFHWASVLIDVFMGQCACIYSYLNVSMVISHSRHAHAHIQHSERGQDEFKAAKEILF